MIKNQLHGARGESNCREKDHNELGDKLESNQQRGSRQGQVIISTTIVCSDNNCDETSFSPNGAEDGEEDNDKPFPQHPIHMVMLK